MIESNSNRYYLNNNLIFTDLEYLLKKSIYVTKFEPTPPPHCLNMPYAYPGVSQHDLDDEVLYLITYYLYGRITFYFMTIKSKENSNQNHFYVAFCWDKFGRAEEYAIYPLFYDTVKKDFYLFVSKYVFSKLDYIPIERPMEHILNGRAPLEEGFNLVKRYKLMNMQDAMLYPIQSTLFVMERVLTRKFEYQLSSCERLSLLKPMPEMEWYTRI